MGFCDPCAAPPLDQEELRGLGVFWLNDQPGAYHMGGMPLTLTRLHVRYDSEHFPEDLMFQQTGDQQPFQGRYILRHPYRGEISCAAGSEYRKELDVRHRQEAATLASLTGWDAARIHAGMGSDWPGEPQQPWWKTIWR